VVRMNILMGHLLADAVEELLRQSDVCAESISVIGSHGLTIGHYPEPDTRFGHRVAGSWQIGDGDVIAERLGIPVVSDFRIRDMAAGGEGAPLVPLLDRQLLLPTLPYCPAADRRISWPLTPVPVTACWTKRWPD